LYLPTALTGNISFNNPVIAFITTSKRNVHNSAFRAEEMCTVTALCPVLNRELFGGSCARYKVKFNLQQATKARGMEGDRGIDLLYL
jgi:hypothetical protein